MEQVRESYQGKELSILSPVLKRNSASGLAFHAPHCQPHQINISRSLRLDHYCADASTDIIIEHNRKWALGKVTKPIFQFAYLMLPTPCNQKCRGCFMGQDKGKLPQHLSGPYFSNSELSGILTFMREHKAKAIVYGGGGELFAWPGALELIETVTSYGFRMIVFTNGTLLTRHHLARLKELNVAIIVSLRDTVEKYHNEAIGTDGFLTTLSTINYALELGFHLNNRLAVEIPVTRENEERVINNFIPAMRYLGIVPLVEEYIQTSTSENEKRCCHSFSETRAFFERATRKDAEFGIRWPVEFGQRMLAQPQCKRPMYSLAIFPSGDVMDCPSHTTCYGNIKRSALHEIVYSDLFRKAMLDFKLCACSAFYTRSSGEIPAVLPDYLESLR